MVLRLIVLNSAPPSRYAADPLPAFLMKLDVIALDEAIAMLNGAKAPLPLPVMVLNETSV